MPRPRLSNTLLVDDWETAGPAVWSLHHAVSPNPQYTVSTSIGGAIPAVSVVAPMGIV